jgi:hypothetical protein
VASAPVYDQFTIDVGLDGYPATVIATDLADANSGGYLTKSARPV